MEGVEEDKAEDRESKMALSRSSQVTTMRALAKCGQAHWEEKHLIDHGRNL